MSKSEEEKAKIREAALATLAAHKDEIDKFDHKIDAQDKKWQNELNLLQRRVETNIKEIQLGDKGETIAIRASLSDYEATEIAKLDDKRTKLDPNTDMDLINDLTYTILSMITANPMMTAEWFKDNRERYSTEDMLSLFLSYLEQMTTRAKRVAEIQQFR